jgi:hypothetical protein
MEDTNFYECPNCSDILLKCIVNDIHIKDLIMLCNKSNCDCYKNIKNSHYALIPVCDSCGFIYYNHQLQECISKSFHCTNENCGKTYVKDNDDIFTPSQDDDFEKYLIKKYT